MCSSGRRPDGAQRESGLRVRYLTHTLPQLLAQFNPDVTQFNSAVFCRWTRQTRRTNPDLPCQDQSRSNKTGRPQPTGHLPGDHTQ
ncbi:hypothetical protein EXN66_Car004029 [Channa argus]|uniref:Uncharacterized protein n=1 Tax=Channa argus TaxID=215402 RepID=A0A6G1PDN9_CHAAH|nr:hypothetical protein EXN66_Car004029 [Channa argus]